MEHTVIAGHRVNELATTGRQSSDKLVNLQITCVD